MKRLVSSNEAAQILGLSLQGVHYRIKKGQLESIKQDGKIFVYVDKNAQVSTSKNKTNSVHNPDAELDLEKFVNNIAIKSKDEQIDLLKKSMKHMKKQYVSEIYRLEKNQKRILDVFQSEVELLKSAFHEMKSIYKIENKVEKPSQIKEDISPVIYKEKVKEEKIGIEFMNLKEFFIFMRKHDKTDAQIKSIILDKIKNGDKRFIYNKSFNEIIVCKSDFIDII
ncbi:MAG: DNA-binding protein [Campylobacterota bacterium]|nr:DNA-binding protein [Campylobacterota bacterium]